MHVNELSSLNISDTICFIGIVKRNGRLESELFRCTTIRSDAGRKRCRNLPVDEHVFAIVDKKFAEYDAQLLDTFRSAQFTGPSLEVRMERIILRLP